MSNQMDEFLAETYGTAGARPVEDQQKVAQQALFAKLAADHNIDLSTLSDAQIKELWDHTFAKSAAEKEKKKDEPEAKSDEDEEKKAEAVAFEAWSKTKEAQVAWQQADRAGRQMAHAYVQEMRKIASDGGLEFLGIPKAAEFPPQFMKKKDEGEKGKDEKDEKKDEKKDEEKKASAPVLVTELDENATLSKIAAKVAYQMGIEAGLEKEALAERLGAVLTLNLVPANNTKVASATDFETAKQIRALELLEAAGYPVTWAG